MTAVIRVVIGETLRGIRLRQRRTLRQVSAAARVSLGYLSEIERGQKEPSSELLAAICGALEVRLSDLFAEVTDVMRRQERLADRARMMPAPAGTHLTSTGSVVGSAPVRPGQLGSARPSAPNVRTATAA